MRLTNSLKAFFLKWLPDFLIIPLKKIHYVHALKAVPEEIDFEPIKSIVKLGDTVIDVGANIGSYTFFLSKMVGMGGKVHSIEPIPSTFEILKYVIKKFALNNVSAISYAVSSEDAMAKMAIPKYDNGAENYYQSHIIDASHADNFRLFEVEIKKLDSLFMGKIDRLTFIKIDVEGHELNVIKGAKGLISRFKPALLIEVSENPDNESSSSYQLFKELLMEGYLPYFFDGEKLKARKKGEQSINYFFLPRERPVI